MRLKQIINEAAFNRGSLEQVITSVAKILQTSLGTFLERVGGPGRIYQLDDTNTFGAVFIKHGTTEAISLLFEPQSANGTAITHIQYWKNWSFYTKADATIVLPRGFNFVQVVSTVKQALASLRPGVYPITATAKVSEMATRTTEADFMRMCQQMYGQKASKLTLQELMACAQQNDVQMPSAIRFDRNLKVDAHHWNMSGGPDGSEVNQRVSKQLGVEVTDDPEVDQDMAELQTAKGLARMASEGKLYLFGRNRRNQFYRVQGVETATAQLERMLARQIEARGGEDRKSMDEQYEELHDRVRLVAGGKSQFIKSLLITGAPSSGKTFSVMKTIKELGYEEGTDYMVKKGRVTTLTLFRSLIEQIDGLLIFDDCDSVVDDKNAINMLKGALDTDPVRELSYDVRGTTNTAVMTKSDRDDLVNAMSRILRGKPEPGDLERFQDKLKKKKKSKSRDRDEYSIDADDDMDDDYEDEYEGDLLGDVQAYVTANLPNKIDFRGRIIFISNMDEGDWDDAILTRTCAMNMNFSSVEMLDYIDKIKGHIRTPNVTDEQKQEVMDYLRELWTAGKLNRPINFRLVQQAFDYRLVDSWKKLIAGL